MKECNHCTTECHPNPARLMSADPCLLFTPIERKFKLPEFVSRVILTNPKSPTVSMLAIHTDRIFSGIS
jgi:hypothetical protein